MKTRVGSRTLRIDALRQVVRLLKKEQNLTCAQIAKECDLDPSLLHRHFLSSAPVGRPRAIATLNVMRFVGRYTKYPGPLPTWRCLCYHQVLFNQAQRRKVKFMVPVVSPSGLAAKLGVGKLQMSQYFTRDQQPDGEVALLLLSYWYSDGRLPALATSLFQDLPVNVEGMPGRVRRMRSKDRQSLLSECALMEQEMLALWQLCPYGWIWTCPSWLAEVLNIPETKLSFFWPPPRRITRIIQIDETKNPYEVLDS